VSIREEIDRMLDHLSDEYLSLVFLEVKRLEIEHNFKQILKAKQIIYDFPNELDDHKEVIEKWKLTFTPLSDSEKADVGYHQFLWHAFSYERLPSLIGDEARRAFNEVNKSDVFFFYQHHVNNEHPFIEVYRNAKQLRAEDIQHKLDAYFFDLTFTWTYIETHEDCCGPYFIQLPK